MKIEAEFITFFDKNISKIAYFSSENCDIENTSETGV